MTEQWERPWLEIPAPDYIPIREPEEREGPRTRGEDDEPLDNERRVIIIDL